MAGAEDLQRLVRDQFVRLELAAFLVVARSSIPDAVIGPLDVIAALKRNGRAARAADDPGANQGKWDWREDHRAVPNQMKVCVAPRIVVSSGQVCGQHHGLKPCWCDGVTCGFVLVGDGGP